MLSNGGEEEVLTKRYIDAYETLVLYMCTASAPLTQLTLSIGIPPREPWNIRTSISRDNEQRGNGRVRHIYLARFSSYSRQRTVCEANVTIRPWESN